MAHQGSSGGSPRKVVDRLQGQGSQLADSLKDNLHGAASQVSEMASQRADQLREAAEEYYAVGRDQITEMGQSLEERIRENPMRAIAIAAGIGLFAGMIVSRRS